MASPLKNNFRALENRRGKWISHYQGLKSCLSSLLENVERGVWSAAGSHFLDWQILVTVKDICNISALKHLKTMISLLETYWFIELCIYIIPNVANDVQMKRNRNCARGNLTQSFNFWERVREWGGKLATWVNKMWTKLHSPVVLARVMSIDFQQQWWLFNNEDNNFHDPTHPCRQNHCFCITVKTYFLRPIFSFLLSQHCA